MNVNWNENLENILQMYDVGIENEINKCVAAFEALDTPIDSAFISCFFDILKCRMNESLRKIQMEYLISMKHDSASQLAAALQANLRPQNIVSNDTASTFTGINSTSSSPQIENDEINSHEESGIDAPSKNEQTMEENIEAAIMKILNDVDDEPPEIPTDIVWLEKNEKHTTENAVENLVKNEVEKVPDTEPSVDQSPIENMETADVSIDEVNIEEDQIHRHESIDNTQTDEINIEDIETDEIDVIQTDNVQYTEEQTAVCQANEVVVIKEDQIKDETSDKSDKSPAYEINIRDIDLESIPLPSSTPPPLPMPPKNTSSPIKCEHDCRIDESMNCLSICSEAETNSDGSLNLSDPSSTGELLGFDFPNLLPVNRKPLKRQNSDIVEPNEEQDKKRKISTADINIIAHEEEVKTMDATETIKEESNATVAEESLAHNTNEIDSFQQYMQKQLDPCQQVYFRKNCDPNIHSKSAPLNCLLCDENNIMPMHYIVVHKNADVFVSRPSPMMAQRILRKLDYCWTVKNDGCIDALCIFCEQTFSMSNMEKWKEHILYHTGELGYYCNECRIQLPLKMAHGPSNCTEKSVVDIFDSDCNTLMLYMCKWCNYMQMHKSRMMRHLKHEHDTIDTNFNRNIERVIVLPDLRPVEKTINTPYELVIESKRFVCSVEKCGKQFPNSSEFKVHFVTNHSAQKTFKCQHCDTLIVKQHRHIISDIFNHFHYHGYFVVECTSCEKVFATDYDILHHFTRNHSNDTIKYITNWIQVQGIAEKKETIIWLQCNVCGAFFENSKQGSEHFLTVHKSCWMDCEAVKMVKKTTLDGTTTCSIVKDKKIFALRRSLNCKMRNCENLSKTKGALIEHFNRDHPRQEIVAKAGKIYVENVAWDKNYKEYSKQHLRFDNHMVFYCVACQMGAGTNRAYINVFDVHAHWMLTHAKSTEPMPFRFYAVELVSCQHCKLIGSFDELKRHSNTVHPNESLAISNILNSKKCALCDYTGDNLAYHLKMAHELVLRMNAFNLIRFTDDTLSKLLAIDVHKKYKCFYCPVVHETKDNIKQHIANDHKLPIKFDVFVDNHNVKIIAGCCQQAAIDMHEFLNHLADPNHLFQTVCSKCNFHTEKLDELFEFVIHQINVHNVMIDAELLFRRILKTRFWQTKVMFGNGLECTKHSLLGTEFDDSKPFDVLVEHLLNIAKEKYMSRDD